MLITCWSVKGGSGTTVVAAALALLAAEQFGDAWLIDLAGDSPAALGAPEPGGPGLGDWLAAPPSVGHDAIARLQIPVADGLALLPVGDRTSSPAARWHTLADALSAHPRISIVDAGTGPPPEPLRERAAHDILVVRACYLALRRAAALSRPPTGIVLVTEPGRALRRADVEHAVGVSVLAEVEWDPAVARAIDAGLLAGRMPRSLRASLGGLAWAA